MNKKEITARNISQIVDLINLIGDAGNNEIYDFTIKDSSGDDRIVFTTQEGNGFKYNYYDHNLTIKYDETEKLVIETKALDPPNNSEFYYATKIIVTYYLDDNTYTITAYANNWSYDNLLNYNDATFLRTAESSKDNKQDLLSTKWFYRLNLYGDDREENITDIIDYYLMDAVTKKEEIDNKLKGILEKLSGEEIKALKKKLSKY